MSVAGIILSNLHDAELPALTGKRTMGAVPFGGQYRLIDFPLSAMVNAGLTNVHIVAHHNYHSLMEHIGVGKDWDLARRTGGIRILPPYSTAYANPVENYDSRMQTLVSVRGLIDRLQENDVICCDCDTVGNPDLSALIAAHRASGAPMTVGVEHAGNPEDGPTLNIWIAKTAFLRDVLREAETRRYTSFQNDVIARESAKGNVIPFRFTERFFRLRSLSEYYRLHMLLASDACLRADLFENPMHPIYTKAQNLAPVKYGNGARVERSLIADGCVVEGTVINSVLFCGVHVGRGAVIENSVVMEDCVLAGRAHIGGAILDKCVSIGEGVTLHGHPRLPFFVEAGQEIR